MDSHTRPRVGFVGLGLIGGSLALALRESGFAAGLLAWDSDPAALQKGCDNGVIDAASETLDALLAAVDIAVLCTPTLASAALLERILAQPGRARCVTDVASVKGPLYALAASRPAPEAARYVPGHPIAGSERSGVGAAREDLFRAQRVILTPGPWSSDAAIRSVQELWAAAGADVRLMDVQEHDALLAATSHLPHVIAYALVDALARSPKRDDLFRFAAGGFRDFTRIASSDPIMWRDIALANRDALLDSMDDFERHFAQLRAAVDRGDGDALETMFRGAKETRDEFARELERRVRAGVPAQRRD